MDHPSFEITDSNSTKSVSKKLSFSLRALLLISLLSGIGFGVLGQAFRQRQVVEWIQLKDGIALYESDVAEINSNPFISALRNWLPVSENLKRDLLEDVVAVKFERFGDAPEKLNDLQELVKLRNLKSLTLIKTEVTDLKGIEKLTQLEELTIESNRIETLEPIGYLKKLKRLHLENATSVVDIQTLEKLTHLKSLKLINFNLSEISFLTNLNNLVELELASWVTLDLLPLRHFSVRVDFQELLKKTYLALESLIAPLTNESLRF